MSITPPHALQRRLHLIECCLPFAMHYTGISSEKNCRDTQIPVNAMRKSLPGGVPKRINTAAQSAFATAARASELADIKFPAAVGLTAENRIVLDSESVVTSATLAARASHRIRPFTERDLNRVVNAIAAAQPSHSTAAWWVSPVYAIPGAYERFASIMEGLTGIPYDPYSRDDSPLVPLELLLAFGCSLDCTPHAAMQMVFTGFGLNHWVMSPKGQIKIARYRPTHLPQLPSRLTHTLILCWNRNNATWESVVHSYRLPRQLSFAMYQHLIQHMSKPRAAGVKDYKPDALPQGWVSTRDVWWPAFALEPTGYLLCCARAEARETNRCTLDSIDSIDTAVATAKPAVTDLSHAYRHAPPSQTVATAASHLDSKHNITPSAPNDNDHNRLTLPDYVVDALRLIVTWLRSSDQPFVPYNISTRPVLSPTPHPSPQQASSSAAAAAAAVVSNTTNTATIDYDDRRETSIARIISFMDSFSRR